MAITHVQLLSLPVRDQDRAVAFYRDALGLEVVADRPLADDRRWVQVRPRGASTSITLVTWFPSMEPGSLKGLVLETDDLDADIEALRGRGVSMTEPENAPWGRFVTFDDPDGNGIVLQATSTHPDEPVFTDRL